MSEFYVSGTGHFGDQNGAAGMEKFIFNERDETRTDADRFRDELLSQGILIEVVASRFDRKTRQQSYVLFGRIEQFQKAKAYCEAKHPSIAVIHVEREDQPKETFAEQRVRAARELAEATAKRAVAGTCERGHGTLRLWEGKYRCWTCGWPLK